MKPVLICTLFLLACSPHSDPNLKIKEFDSLYDKAMFNDTYFREDTVIKTNFSERDTLYLSFMYDHISGTRNIKETVYTSSDSIKEYSAFFQQRKLYKIYVIAYRKAEIEKRTDYAKSLYYFDGDTILSQSEYKLSLNLKSYREHFEHLAKNFNDTLNLK